MSANVASDFAAFRTRHVGSDAEQFIAQIEQSWALGFADGVRNIGSRQREERFIAFWRTVIGQLEPDQRTPFRQLRATVVDAYEDGVGRGVEAREQRDVSVV